MSKVSVPFISLGLFWWHTAAGALLMQEGFAGAAGTTLAANAPWAGNSGPGLQIVAGSLALDGVPATVPAGNMLQISGGTQTLDDYCSFTSPGITSGTVYFSALVNCASLPANRQFVLALAQGGATQGNPPDDPLDLYVVGLTNGTGYHFAVRHMGSDSATAAALLTTNTTHLLVMKYDFSLGRSSLYVDPPAGSLEPTRPDAITDSGDEGGSQNPANLQRLIFESAAVSGQGTVLFDSLRLGQQWWDVVQVNTAAIGPASLTNCLGSSATFTVTAAGTAPFTYQWRTNGAPVAGATTSLYTLASPGPGDTLNTYDAIVTDQFGSATSRVATLTLVSVPPAVTIQPTNPVVQGSPSNATFSVTAAGDAPLYYQWRVNGNSINGATRRTYTLSNPPLSATNNAYDVVVSNPCGSVISSPAAHIMFPPPRVTVAGPQDQVVCAGSTVTFTVATTGTAPFTYQWRSGGVAINGATTNSYVMPNVGPGSMPGAYDVIVNDANGSTTSRVASLTVSTTPPGITLGPTNLIIRPIDTSALFAVAATGDAPLVYQWRTNGVAIAGATNTTWTVTNLAPALESLAFDVVVANPCGSVTSSPAQLVFPHPFFACGASPGFFGGMNLATTNSPGIALFAWSSFDLSAPLSTWTLEGQLAEQPLNDGSGNSYYEINVNPSDPVVYYVIGLTTVPPYLAPVPIQWITTDPSGAQTLLAGKLDVSSAGVLSFPPNPFYGCGASPGFFGGMNLATTNGPGATLYAWSSPALTQSITNWALEGQLAEQPLNDGSGNSYYEINVNPLDALVYYIVGPSQFGPYVTPVPVEWVATDASGNYTFGVTNLMIDSSGTLGFLSLPVLVAEPAAQTVLAGKTATFSVTATGAAPLSFQWYFNSNTPLTGGTNSALNLPGVTLTQAGTYFVVVTSTSGSVTSSPAALTVLPPPVLSLRPVQLGFQLSAVGLPGDILWLEATTNLASPIAWTRVATSVADATGLVQFTVANTAPRLFYRLGTASSIPTQPVLVQPPVNRTALAGRMATFNVLAAGALPLSYQWYSNSVTPLTGATGDSLQVAAPSPGSYSVVVTNSYGAVTSEVVHVTVAPPPLLRAQLGTNGFQFSGAAVPGDSYWVQRASTLTPPVVWVNVATNVVGADGVVRFADTNPSTQSLRFYRLLFP